MTKLDELLERKRKIGNIGAIDFLIDRELKHEGIRGESLIAGQKPLNQHKKKPVHALPHGTGATPTQAPDPLSFRAADGNWSPALLDLQYEKAPVPATTSPKHPELVSIIIPSYNNQKWLRRAINSARSQKDVSCEIIVVDDGSTDSSVTIASGIAEVDYRVRVVSSLRNFGCYYARNIGVLNATGEYITILDSDDIMSPDRISRQLSALKGTQHAIACLPRLRRWSNDFRKPLGPIKFGEVGLLWKHNVINTIGWYDSVKYGGDSEFRERLESQFGRSAVVRIKDELYFARTVDDSLTTKKETSAHDAQKTITSRIRLSKPRELYEAAFNEWHAARKKSTPNKVAQSPLRIIFPQRSRPFHLGDPSQSASPSIGQRIVGKMASFPPRGKSLETAIGSILPQLDQLVLYLNNYDKVPSFVQNPKIKVHLGKQCEGDLRDNGKYYAMPQDDETYVFLLDDDIRYPPDYVAKMVHHIEMFDRTVAVGVHGITFPDTNFSSLSQRKVYSFHKAANGHFVDMVGTGTVAWHTSTMKLSLSDAKTFGLSDIWFAVAASRNCVPLLSIPRGDRWLKLINHFDASLWEETNSNPSEYFELYENILAPTLRRENQRKRIEKRLSSQFSAEILAASGIEMSDFTDQSDIFL